MAGAGYKLFNTGDVLTAAQVNTYLQEQVVMVFANSTSRTTALSGVLAEGMVSYLQDTNAVEVYNGSAWVGISGAGDITEVQAGTGISVASGTGPIPVVTNTMATAIDAEGDLIIGDAADAFQRLAIGSNGNVLTVDTSVDGKIKWAAPSGGASFVGVEVYASANQSTSNAVDFYRPFNTENWDTDGFHSTTTNTERLTVPSGQAGKYWVYANQGHAAFSTGYASYTFSVNRTLEVGRVYVRPYASQAIIIFSGIVLDLAVGDYVELLAYQGSGGSLDILGGRALSTFGMYKIG